MSEPMSQQFVHAFLATCFDAGLSKEAAAELLQKESVDQVLAERPAFAEGYLRVASQFPGQLRPMVFDQGGDAAALYKEAARAGILGGLGQAAKGLLWDAPVGIGKALFGVGRGAAKGVGRTFGPQKTSLLERHPFPVAMGGMAATGGGVYGVNKLMNRDKNLSPYGVDPFLPPGGHSREQHDNIYKNRLAEYEPGIFETNKEYDSSAGRIKELETAIAEGRAGGNAYQELQRLRGRRSHLGSRRTQHGNELDRSVDRNRDLMDRIARRQESLENQRTAWWAAPRRWWHQARGGNVMDPSISQNYFDGRIGQLHDRRAEAQMQTRLAKDRARMLRGGATGRAQPSTQSDEQLTQRFFPSYQ